MAKITLPKSKILNELKEIASNIQLFAAPNPTSNNGDVVYNVNSELVEDVLKHDDIIKIVTEGGNVENYLMYAACPFDIYTKEVPTELPESTMKATTGTGIVITNKQFAQWANGNIKQTFSEDFKTIYVTTTPLGNILDGKQLKLVVDGLMIRLLTLSEYKQIPVITE